MATIVDTLFGISPERIQQERDAAANAQALQFARLDPFQQATFSAARGGYALGGAIGGLLGGQDPELQRATLRQQIAGQIDFNDEASMKRGIAALAQSDPQGAMQLQQIYLSQAKTRAETSKALRERQAADPFEQLVRSGKYTPASLAAYRQSGNVGSLDLMEKPNKPLVVGNSLVSADGVVIYEGSKPEKYSSFAQELIDAGLTPGTESFKQMMLDYTTGKIKGVEKGTGNVAITNVLPGLKGAPDIVGLRSTINTTLKPYRDGLNAANSAIMLADDVLKTGNFASNESLSRALAKASGETQLSKADVAAFGGDPSFIGSISDIASRLGTGAPTADTTRKLKALAVLLKKKNESLEKDEIKQLQTTAKASGLYTDEQIKTVFTLRGETKGATRKTAGGVSYTVED